ncbi:MAG: acetyl-CoA carboxylase biotin carboxyl carrier protein subunit [Candidatus Cloacimonadota bacterium]|nr:MAG: acetyl-CoA carboxylase biotin carboxyl carrier protein subunit [Candidatus Cloacimonadota bacterium]
MKELIEQAKDLMRWADEYGLDEISLSNGEDSIKILKNAIASAPLVAAPVIVNSVSSTPVKKEKPQETKIKNEKNVISPMIGTFYISARPGAAPFKKVGDSVKEGDTVCIVEAMKVMNQIKSPFSGVVTKILAKNAEVVYKGQLLFEIA